MGILTREQLKEIKQEILKDIKPNIENVLLEVMDGKSFTDKLISKVSETLEKTLEKSLNEFKQQYEKTIQALEIRTDSLEQYSRRKNVRIFGLAENPQEILKNFQTWIWKIRKL